MSTTSPSAPPTSRPDDDCLICGALGYKAGFDTGHEAGYLKGKLAYWFYLVLGYFAEQGNVSPGGSSLPDCYLEALKLLKKLDKPGANIPAYVLQAQANFTPALKTALDNALATV